MRARRRRCARKRKSRRSKVARAALQLLLVCPCKSQTGAVMNFGQAIKSGFSNYVTFSGRAARSEFWYWTLFVVLVTMAAGILDHGLFDFDEPSTTGVFGPLVSLIFFLPGLA